MIQSIYNKYKTKIRNYVIRNNPKLKEDYENASKEKADAWKHNNSLNRSEKSLQELINF
jgi:uncharacterized phage-associated protein